MEQITDNTLGLASEASPENRERLFQKFQTFIETNENSQYLREFIHELVPRIQKFLGTSIFFTVSNPIYNRLSYEISSIIIIEYATQNNHTNHDIPISDRMANLQLNTFRNEFIVSELLRFFGEDTVTNRWNVGLFSGGIPSSIENDRTQYYLIRVIHEIHNINIAQNNTLREMQECIKTLTEKSENCNCIGKSSYKKK
jgi:hypothetical protein